MFPQNWHGQRNKQNKRLLCSLEQVKHSPDIFLTGILFAVAYTTKYIISGACANKQ
jgi:hypothetical protein